MIDSAIVVLPDHRDKHAPYKNLGFLIPKTLPVGKRGWLLGGGQRSMGRGIQRGWGKMRSRAGMFFLPHGYSPTRSFLSWCFKKKAMQHTPGMGEEGELAGTSTSALVLNFYIY